MTDTADIHDTSDIDRLDQHFADKRDAELNAQMDAEKAKTDVARTTARTELVRKAGVAALLGGTGLGLALFGASFLLHPMVPGKETLRETVREVPGPERVATKEVPGPERVVTKEVRVPGPERVVTKEVPGPERIVTKEVPGPERVVIKEVIKEVPVTPAAVVPAARPAPTASLPAKIPDAVEKTFVDDPAYKSAEYRGRLVTPDANEVKFDDGRTFFPARINPSTQEVEPLNDMKNVVEPFIGDYAYCNKNTWNALYACYVIDNDAVKEIPQTKWFKTSEPKAPNPAAADVSRDIRMVVALGESPYEMVVDTGCSWPMVLPLRVADRLVSKGDAIEAGLTNVTLADGTVQSDRRVILIKRATVAGRVIGDVEAVVMPDANAPLLIGLPALTLVGKFTISGNKVTFS